MGVSLGMKDRLKRSEHPDRTEMHAVERGHQGGSSLGVVDATAHEERQVFAIPAIRIAGTAQRAEITIRPGGGAKNRGCCPAGVAGLGQDGSGVKTWAISFQSQHGVPMERPAQLFADLLHHRIAEGTLVPAGQELSVGVEPATAAGKEQ